MSKKLEKEVDVFDFPSDFSEIDIDDADIDQEFLDFHSRLSDRLGLTSVVSALAAWITRNTYLNDAPFSFHEHEFQEAIANDTHPDVSVIKCSQVGLSELSVRIALALLGISNGMGLIYVLPSAKFAAEFSKARIDPVIESSPKLMAMLVTAANSATMKRFGNSILYVGGAASEKQAISRPAQALITDEYDFCNSKVMTMYASRLRHAKNPIVRKFSTPTVDDFGISKEVKNSSQLRYMVKCNHCGHRYAPEFRTDLIIPGFTGETFEDFDREDLHDPEILVEDAYMACQKCRKSVEAALRMPDHREWVALYPQRTRKQGYIVRPYDVPEYNNTSKIIYQLGEYSRTQDFYNFVLGEVHANDSNQINVEMVRKKCINDYVAGGTGFYMGVDVGKTCHILIGKPGRDGRKIDVVAAFKVRAKDGPLDLQIAAIYKRYGIYRMVIDAGPDFTLGQSLIQMFGQFVHQSPYIKGSARDLTFFRHIEQDNSIHILRTKGFDALTEEINKGKWTFPAGPDGEEITEHMKGMKRVEETNDEGERVPRWVKTGDFDHFLHAAMYLKTAIDFDEGAYAGASQVVGSPGVVLGVSIGGKSVEHRPPPTLLQLARTFGVR